MNAIFLHAIASAFNLIRWLASLGNWEHVPTKEEQERWFGANPYTPSQLDDAHSTDWLECMGTAALAGAVIFTALLAAFLATLAIDGPTGRD